MDFNPVLTVTDGTQPTGCFQTKVDENLRRIILDFVQARVNAIRDGQRAKVDATYDPWGLGLRDHAIRREDHERTSYYDWYLNRLERGFSSAVSEIQVIPIGNANQLPFRFNVTWSDLPQFELRIRTFEASVSWLVRLRDRQLCVVLPNFSGAPWKEPILETRGGGVEFNARKFAMELGGHLGLEFCSWSARLNGLAKIRAFALSVDPYNGVIHPSLLTDKENFDESQCGKWSLGDWRLYDFTSSPASHWPYGQHLCQLIRDYVSDKNQNHKHPKFDYWVQSREAFEIMIACAMSLREPEFLKYLQRFELNSDFELGVFHAHDEKCECNFVLEENQGVSMLIKHKGI
jgi:hypothetical protein